MTAMTPEAAVSALGLLAIRYAPRPMPWTDPAADDETRRATMHAWVRVATGYPTAAVLAAIERVCTESPDRTPTLNVFLAATQAEARRIATDDARARAITSAIRCDGTGWIARGVDTDDRPRLEPCPACNPFVRDEWSRGRYHDADPRAWRERRAAWTAAGGVVPPACHPTGGVDEPVVSIPTGRRIAVVAYRAAGGSSPATVAVWAGAVADDPLEPHTA